MLSSCKILHFDMYVIILISFSFNSYNELYVVSRKAHVIVILTYIVY